MSNDKNSLVYQDQLDDNVMEMLTEDIGSNYSLRTENQRTIVDALNEIHGKDVIASAVGDPLLNTDTYAEMETKIKELILTLKSKLMGLGVSVTESDKLNALINKLENIQVGAGVEEIEAAYSETLRNVLIEKGITVDENRTLSELIVMVENLIKPQGNAVAGDVLEGKTFVNETGEMLTGTLKKSTGNATVAQVLSGYTFSNANGVGLTGSMTNNGAKTFTPSASQQTSGAGYYSGITCNPIAGIHANYIISGKTIGGVEGVATPESMGGITYKMGSIDVTEDVQLNDYVINTGLSYTPNYVFIQIRGAITFRGPVDTTERQISGFTMNSFAYTNVSTRGTDDSLTFIATIEGSNIILKGDATIKYSDGSAIRWYAIGKK